MVQKRRDFLTDGISGVSGADVTRHSFDLNGISYEINLSTENYQVLLSGLGPFIAAARRAPNGMAASGTLANRSRVDTRQVRAWAHERGIDIKPRGPIPREVWIMYESARDAPIQETNGE
ncbi:histone-like nucleoid-structuring protein Lsr2 [Streptomyces sp. 1222.5]